MTRTEFAKIMAFLGASVSKPVAIETAEAYFAMLGDLPVKALEAAAMIAVVESQYPTLPPIGVLRRLAVEAIEATSGAAAVPEPPQAAVLVSRVLKALAFEREAALAALPDVVRRAAEEFGWGRLRDSRDWNVTAAQFRDFYATVARRAQRERLLPDVVRRTLQKLTGPDRPGLTLLGEEPCST